jgi:ATP phosphoribosyltransferase regulatory subunit
VGSDLEAMSLMLEMLMCAGLDDLHLDLGHVGIYRALIQEATLPSQDERQLFDLLQRKAMPELRVFLAGHPMSRQVAGWLWALPDLNGPVDVLARARTVLAGAGAGVEVALAELTRLAERLEQRYPQVTLHLDLAELRGYDYHTGVVFAAYGPASAGALALGGRYDGLGAAYGRARPATGFSLDLRELARLAPNGEARGAILADCPLDEAARDEVRQLRAAGERVMLALPGHAGTWRQAGCDRVLTRRGDQWVIEPLKED